MKKSLLTWMLIVPLIFSQIFSSFVFPSMIKAEVSPYFFPWQHNTNAVITNTYGESSHGPGKIDFDISNEIIVAPKDGTIIYANDTNKLRTSNGDYFYYWNSIVIKHADNEYTSYHHLKQNSIPSNIRSMCSTNVGTQNCSVSVKAGQQIGLQGNTGWTLGQTGVHLHMQLGTSWSGPRTKPDSLDQDGDSNRTEAIGYAQATGLRSVPFIKSGGLISVATLESWTLNPLVTSYNPSTYASNSFGTFVDGKYEFLPPADVNGDQKADIIVFNRESTKIFVGVALENGFDSMKVWNEDTDMEDWVFFPPADVTGDGKADIISYRPKTRAIDVIRSTGNNFGGGTKGYEVWNSDTAMDSQWVFFAPADVTGDGLADIISYLPSTRQIDVIRSTGNNFGGGYRGYEVWNTDTRMDTSWVFLDPADVTGDGLADIISFYPGTTQIDIIRSTGSNFGGGDRGYEVWNTDSDMSYDWKFLSPGSVNIEQNGSAVDTARGISDIITFNTINRKIDVILSDGSSFGGGVHGYQIWNTDSGYSEDWVILPPADVDGDRMVDIIAYRPASGKIDVTRSTGTNFGGGTGGFEVWYSNVKVDLY